MGEDRGDLRELRASADAACHDALRGLGDRLDARLWQPALEALRAAQGAHIDVAEAAGLTGPCPEDPLVARDKAAQYLVAVAEQVHRPFVEGLRGCAPIATVVAVFNEVTEAADAACDGLPRGMTVPRSREDLAAGPHDSMGRRTGRSVARILAGIGLGGDVRTVDARSVALRHRALLVKPGQERARGEALRRWGAWLADVEAAWAAWASPLLTSLGDDMGDGADGAVNLWRVLTEASAALEGGYSALISTCPHAALIQGFEGEVARWNAVLESDLSVAGTFLLGSGIPKERPSARSDVDGWRKWQEEALARLDMHGTLLAVFAVGSRSCTELEGRLRGESLDPWAERIQACAVALRELAAAARASSRTTQTVLDSFRGKAMAELDAAREACPNASELESIARRAAGLTVGAVQSGLREVPSAVVIHRLPTTARPLRRPDETKHTLALQDMARQSFDALRMERIRKAPAAIIGTADEMGEDLKEVSEIVAFGFDAGAAELASEVDDDEARARELVAEGLDRAAAAVEAVPELLAKSTRSAASAVRGEILRGFSGLASRALAHRMQGQFLEARTRLARALEELQRRAGPGVRRELHRLRVGWVRVRRSVSWLLRRGKSLVGAESGTLSAAGRTVRTLATVDEMLESLPLVYQHLFTTEPVTDPGLLSGRQTELGEMETRWRRWHEGKGIPLLVVGRRGSGISSLFNVFVARVSADGSDAVQHTLMERIDDEVELAAYLSDLMGLASMDTLDALAATILEAPEGGVPDLIALEGLEHVYLRIAGGTDLLERLFTLMAETEPRIFWMASLTSSAWQIVKKAEPAAGVQLDCIEVAPLPSPAIQEAVMHRHRRSGMQLRFEEPAEGRRLLLRRRLRRLRGTGRHQELLQADYFERLHRSTQGNLSLTYFQWLRSVDFTQSRDSLVVHPLPELDWSFLDSLDLNQNFTIKAFLEHQTLTLDEHDRIFRCTRQESYHILDSLVNRQIIEVVPSLEDHATQVSRVLGHARYRIRPLLTGAVAAHLASRNIVH